MAQGADKTTGRGRPEAELFAEMRRIKEAARLSYNRLADKTHYSRSSWERFLNGKQVPTRVAVEEFATAAGADPLPLLALLGRLDRNPAAPAAAPAAGRSAAAAEPAKAEAEAEVEVAPGSAPGAFSDPAAPAGVVPQGPAPSGTAPEPPAPPAPAAPSSPVPASDPDAAEAGPVPAAAGPVPAAPVPVPAAPVPAPAAPVPAPAADHDHRSPRARRRAVLAMAACALAGAVLGSVLTVIGLSGVAATSGGADAAFGSHGRSATTAPADGGTGTEAPAPRPTGPVRTGCKSDTCLLREPQAMDCQWDATTVRKTWLRGMSIQLRYSPACQSVWGRIEAGNIGDTVSIRDKRGLSDQAAIRMEHDTYTRMLAVTPQEPWETITVCGSIPNQKEEECSPLGGVKP
ncbi:helix-turn-helix domain-containing protein [Streptomyces sp. NPDC101118]|uniref:helix-turn-helix domain-containing protein n=1 Tax=Streptomyces sp. NPDC101118 TaxID=3366109 RepID=UPI0038239686